MDVLAAFALVTAGLIALTVWALYRARKMLDRGRRPPDGPP